ncbi:MAG: carbon-monoxide dehydrogenase large subunit [Paracoccaceae bacterium]|jgi:carbon-monoxide dehydrogenase large subunit
MSPDGVATGVGASVLRREDRRLLQGGGEYSDDINLPGQLHAVMVRAPHAHADIRSVDTSAATAVPNVMAVLTGADYIADGIGDIGHGANPAGTEDWQTPAFVNRDGSVPFDRAQPPIIRDRVRHAGEIVAVVIGETGAAAQAAADLIVVDYAVLPVVTDALAALDPGAPTIWDECPGNVPLDADIGDAAATDAAFAEATHVIEARFFNNRVINCQMEPRAAIGEWEPDAGKLTLHAGGQGVHRHKMILGQMFGLTPDQVRVTSKDVGGGFGPRNMMYPEFVMVCWAARRIGRPVKWCGDRSEAFVTDYQARDLYTDAALALDDDGNFLALRADLVGNLGAHTVSFVPLSNGPRLLPSVYRLGAAYARIRGVLTNTVPTGPYRGAGRPEAMHVIERLIDMAAARMGVDRIELRRRNLIAADAFPATNAMQTTYDCGEFEICLDKALDLADWDGFDARRTAAAANGKLRGIGYASYIQAPVGAPVEFAAVTVNGDGTVDVPIGTQSSGQGHETVFPQLVSELLGVPYDAVRIVTGDSDVVGIGGGSHSDRSMRLGGIVMREASDKVIEKGREIAVELLEAAAEDITFTEGVYRVTGTDRTVGLFDVAASAEGQSITADSLFRGRSAAYPNGAAVSEVEIDPATGTLSLVAHATVDDPGRAINPMILAGQAHGSIVQGVGQAMIENGYYDPETGQLIAGSFMDYGLLRADDVPNFKTGLHEVPTKNNALGVKGGGEGATVSATAAFINAVCDALRDYGVRDIEMPATPERIWRAIQGSGASA